MVYQKSMIIDRFHLLRIMSTLVSLFCCGT